MWQRRPCSYDVSPLLIIKHLRGAHKFSWHLHALYRCEEAENEKTKTSGRLAVEEAISDALIRKCPSCKRPFVKESGCNKITCGCGTKCCYLCMKVIRDYSHFCQVPHCDHTTCGTCPLYTDDARINAHAMRRAGMEAANNVQAAPDVVANLMK